MIIMVMTGQEQTFFFVGCVHRPRPRRQVHILGWELPSWMDYRLDGWTIHAVMDNALTGRQQPQLAPLPRRKRRLCASGSHGAGAWPTGFAKHATLFQSLQITEYGVWRGEKSGDVWAPYGNEGSLSPRDANTMSERGWSTM